MEESNRRRIRVGIPVSIFIPVVNRIDLLKLAIQSVKDKGANVVIIDNSQGGDVTHVKLGTAGEIEIIRPPVPLTFAQTQNWMRRIAIEQGMPYYFFMHNDAEAQAGVMQDLKAVADGLNGSGSRWGFITTNYDTLACYNTKAVEEIGEWDTNLPWYYGDNDYYRRLELAGYPEVKTDLKVVHHNDASNTLKADKMLNFINGITFPMFGVYYARKWGGVPKEEKYSKPFKGQIN